MYLLVHEHLNVVCQVENDKKTTFEVKNTTLVTCS